MRLYSNTSPLNRKIRAQIFIFLSAAPVLMLILIGLVFFKLYQLSDLIDKKELFIDDIEMYLSDFFSQIFVAALFTLAVVFLQIYLLVGFIKKILPTSDTTEIREEDKEILNHVKVMNFDNADEKDTQSANKEQ